MVLITLGSILLVFDTPKVVQKFVNGSSLVGESPRQRMRNFAYYVFKIDPLLGTGMGNFPNFNHEDIREIVVKNEGFYDEKKFMPYDHPHNIYWSYLSGGGITLFSVFVFFWLKVSSITYHARNYKNEKLLVFTSLSVILTILGIGWVNTTLAHENALMTMFLIGLLISKYRTLS